MKMKAVDKNADAKNYRNMTIVSCILFLTVTPLSLASNYNVPYTGLVGNVILAGKYIYG
jgi:hypothetical protein